jgi:hypothetical protein
VCLLTFFPRFPDVVDSEAKQVRAIFRWVCHNISYAVCAPKARHNLDVLTSRVVGSEGYANVVMALCTAVGIDCVKVLLSLLCA